MNTLIKGTGVALVTPFDTSGEVDYQSLRNLVDTVIFKGVDFVVAMGTTSEAATLTKDEKQEVVRTIIDEVDNRVSIVLGLGGNNTQAVIEEIKTTNFEKIDAILSVAPYYNKPSQEGMIAHFSAIAEVSPVDIVLYNVPGRTSSNLSAQTVLKLANSYSNIIAVKEASSDFSQIMEIIQNKPDHFKVLSGDDALTLPLMSIGMEGVISVVANVFPNQMSSLINAINVGDYDEAKNIHYKILNLTNALFEEGNPSGIKAALQHKGIIESDNLRLPLVPISEPLKTKIKNLLQ
jgi:4-hydroxy-tetrahydrodipicolinate synthase